VKRLIVFIALFSLIAGITPAFAETFNFYGSTKYSDGTAMNNTNVTIYIYTMSGQGPPTLNSTFSAVSIETGNFNITNVERYGNAFYKPVIRHFNSSSNTYADYIGASLPEFPVFEVARVSPVTFYLKNATTLNISAINASGNAMPFQYQIKDKKLGYSIQQNFGSYVTNVLAYVPSERNYSIMIYPNQSFPVSQDVSGLSGYYSKVFNCTESMQRLTGYVNRTVSGLFDNLSIISYLMEPGRMVFAGDNSMAMYNFSGSDIFNAASGFYNISVFAPVENATIIVFVIAQNSTDYYGGFKEVSLSYGNDPSQTNFTVFGLVGSLSSINATGGGGPPTPIPVKKMTFRLLNSTGSVFSNTAFLEVKLNYNSFGMTNFTFMLDVGQSSNGVFRLPLLNVSGIDRMNIYTSGGSPTKKTFTAAQLATTEINITIKDSFNMKNPEGGDLGDLFIDMVKNTAACNVPAYNPASCSLFVGGQSNVNQINPLSVVMSGASISFRMKNANNITVHYINVDLLASGPPDAVFDSNSTDTEGATSMQQAWRFGSTGPEIYDRVLIGMPYSDADLDDSMPITMRIPYLYNETWGVVWNISTNTTAHLPSDYADYASPTYQAYVNSSSSPMPCSKTNPTATCFVNTTDNMIWITIPHFSGVAPQIQGYPDLGTMTSDKTVYSCYPGCTAYINVTMNNTALQGTRNITINNTAMASGITWRMQYLNLSNTSQWISAGENNTLIGNYSFVLYNASTPANTTHQFKFTIILKSALTTKWNFTLTIDNATDGYTLDPLYLDSINLTAPANASTSLDTSSSFSFVLYSNQYTTQNCSLYVNSTLKGTNSSVLNGSTTTITATNLNAGTQAWYVICNETGQSDFWTVTVNDTIKPTISISLPQNITYSYNTSLPLNYTVGDTLGGVIDKCWFNLDHGDNTTLTNCANATFNASQGSHILYIFANDTAGNLNNTVTIGFTADSIKPTISISLPSNTTYNYNTSLPLNYTASDTRLDQCWFNLDNGANTTLTNCANATFNASQGSHVLYIFANDTAGNLNNTVTIGFTADSIKPTIAISLPTNTTYYYNTSLPLNFTASDTRLDQCWFNLDNGGNTTLTSCANATFNASEGYHTLYIFANDTAGNLNNTVTRGFRASLVIVNLSSPVTGNTSYSTNMTFRCNVTDNLDIRNISIWTNTSGTWALNQTINISVNVENNYSAEFNLSTISLGSFIWNIQAFDNASTPNEGWASSNWTFTVATTTTTTTTTTLASGGGGGGGGTTTTTIPKSKNNYTEMTTGVVHKIKITNKDIGFKQIIIEVRNKANNVTIIITKLAGQPATVIHNITGKVYQYIEITHDNLSDSNLKSAKIRFNVTKTWINGNNFTKEHIYLNRYSNNAWQKLQTLIISESSSEVEYEADTPGLSIFAITGEAVETTTTTTIPPEVTTTTLPVTTTTTAEQPSVPAEYYSLYMLILVLIIIAVLGWMYFHGHKKLPLFKKGPIHE